MHFWGVCFWSQRAWRKCEFVRKAEDFSDPRNARLFAAIAAISDTEPSWQVQDLLQA